MARDNTGLEAEPSCLFYALFAVVDGANLAAETYLAESEHIVSYRDILEARNKRKRNGEVGRGFIELESADDIYICIHIAKEIARPLFEDG